MRWRDSRPGGDRGLAELLSHPECRRTDVGLRVIVTTDVGLRGFIGAGRATCRRPLRRAQGRGVRDGNGRHVDHLLARSSLDRDRRPGARRDVPPRDREGGCIWPLNGARTYRSAGRPWRWRGSPPWRWSRRCWSRADPAAWALASTAVVLLAPAFAAAWRLGEEPKVRRRWSIQVGSFPQDSDGDHRPADVVRPALRVRGRATGLRRPLRDGGGHTDVGLAEPGARPRRDGPPSGLRAAVGARQPVPGDGGLARSAARQGWPSSRRSAASRSPGRSG